MNSPGVRQLAATVENLRRDLKRRRVEEKNLTQLVRRQQLKQTTTGLAERREFFVMQLLALATCDPAAAVAWLEADALRRNALPLGPLSPETLVENVLHTADIAAVINGPLPTSAKHISWTRAAAKWYYEWQLNNVVLHGAHHKGLPTPTARLLTLRSSASGLDTSAVRVRLTALPSSARLWAHRFRRRYGLRVKRCGWRDRLPEHVLHQKVFCFLIFQHFRIIRTSLPVTFSAFVPTTTRLCTYSKLLFMRNLRRQRHRTTCECVSFIANSLCKVPPHFQEKAVSSHKMRAIFWTRPAGRFGAPHTCEAHKPEAAQRTPKLLHQLQNYDPPAPCTFFHYTALTTACTSQVMATWQWYNYLASNAAGKTLLRINLDETSIPFLLTGTTGTAPQSASSSHDLRINATRARARANFSFLGIVCDNKLIQQALPYIFLVRKTHVGKGPLAALRSALPPNVIIWRLDKAWTTIEIMLSLIRILKACLQPWLHTHQPILLFDALAAHINLRVLQALIHLFRNSPPCRICLTKCVQGFVCVHTCFRPADELPFGLWCCLQKPHGCCSHWTCIFSTHLRWLYGNFYTSINLHMLLAACPTSTFCGSLSSAYSNFWSIAAGCSHLHIRALAWHNVKYVPQFYVKLACKQRLLFQPPVLHCFSCNTFSHCAPWCLWVYSWTRFNHHRFL